MFWGCKSLSNIDPLKNWDVSNGERLKGIFCECTSLSDVEKKLKKWKLPDNIYDRQFSGF